MIKGKKAEREGNGSAATQTQLASTRDDGTTPLDALPVTATAEQAPAGANGETIPGTSTPATTAVANRTPAERIAAMQAGRGPSEPLKRPKYIVIGLQKDGATMDVLSVCKSERSARAKLDEMRTVCGRFYASVRIIRAKPVEPDEWPG
jgi:hypothetical protein